MTDPEPWEDLVVAENEYIARRMAMYSAGAERQVRLALSSPRGIGAALRVLIDAPVELVMSLIDVVFGAAVTTHPQVGAARQVLGRLDPGWLASALPPLVAGRLGQSDVSWEDYRRTAELLSVLGQRSLLDELVRRAAASDDPDIKEEDRAARSALMSKAGTSTRIGLPRTGPSSSNSWKATASMSATSAPSDSEPASWQPVLHLGDGRWAAAGRGWSISAT